MKKLITLLEGLTNKKVILEDSVFKPRKLDERLLPFKKELEKHMTIDHVNKTIVINKSIEYPECLVLKKFYQDYTVDVNGNISLYNKQLKQLPKVLFNKVSGYFNCSRNLLTSLEYCSKIVDRSFSCVYNKLDSLEHCQKEVDGIFCCFGNKKSFTKEEVKEYCDVKENIYC